MVAARHYDSLHICPQKMGHALTAAPAVDRWDWRCILGNVVRFSRLPDIPKLTDRKGFRNLDRKYALTLCVICGETSNPDDRQIGRYDDSDWSRKNPNRSFGKEISRNGTKCAEYCPHIKVTSLNDWVLGSQQLSLLCLDLPTDLCGTHAVRIQRGPD